MPLVIDEVARRYPELRQIMAHMGHPWQRDTVAVLRKNPHVYADVSALWARRFDGYLALVNAQEWGVVDKLLFGSDYPLWTPAEAIASLRELCDVGAAAQSLPTVSPDTIETILNANPLEDLRLTRAADAVLPGAARRECP
jgi:predicted TIM-barrel fold metal-dependent hydrolase